MKSVNSLAATLLTLALAVLPHSPAPAQVPQNINYQGYLTSNTGQPVNATVPMAFALYAAVDAPNPLWNETQASVQVANGVFNVMLGSVVPITLTFNQPYYLGIKVGADAEMTPRQALAAAPYALRAASADGVAPTATIPGTQISGNIAASQLTGPITAATVPGSQITGAITTATISAAQITGPIITAGNISLVPSTATEGNILKGSNRFIHNFGGANTFIGENAGNFTMTGSSNTGSGATALSLNTTGFDNTATGRYALSGNTTGSSNTASGMYALGDNRTGSNNTASGAFALGSNTIGNSNTASGAGALFANLTGENNTASGYQALLNNTTGVNNTASGTYALNLNTIGRGNTASGFEALLRNTTGEENTASGAGALYSNTTGSSNTASGTSALYSNTTGTGNTASGLGALVSNTTGSDNIALGHYAGFSLTTGSDNIAIGNGGVAGESNTIWIGFNQTRTFIAGISGVNSGGVAVFVNGAGQLGISTSSRRFKDDIADMDAASSALMKLRPVTFRYKKHAESGQRTLQYGLVAEEVAEVYPELVARSNDGQLETVMYQFLAPMLLNEYQKQQRTLEAQAGEMAKQIARIAELEQDRRVQTARIEALEQQAVEIAGLRQQAARMAILLERLERTERVNTAGR